MVGVLTLLVGVYALAYSYSLSLGELTSPGPGMWPFVISAVIILCSIMVLVTERSSEDYEQITSRARVIGLGLLSLGVFILLFEQIGFIVPALLTLAFWLRFIGEESWRLTGIITILATAGFYVVFVVLLGVPFPSGPFPGL